MAKKNTALVLYVGLVSQATGLLQVNPTIAAGDFQVSTDGAAFANLATLPVVTPAGGRAVKISLSAGEMNGDTVVLQCVDAVGAEWSDQLINIPIRVYIIDDLYATAVADSVPADGTRPSPTQALYMLAQFMNERSVSGTTVTVKKVDGATTLMTFTLDSASVPTSITRAT